MLEQLKSFLQHHRFEIFLSCQVAILFGSLLFSTEIFEYTIQPTLIMLTIVAGINLISSHKPLMWFFIVLFLITGSLFGSALFVRTGNMEYILPRISLYLLFFSVITVSMIKQVLKASIVNKNVIMGLVSGYIALGFVSFFIFLIIELVSPGAFKGVLLETENFLLKADSIMYYAFITLLTIGYGEIVPVAPVAQKAAILTGLVGQFYLIIIMTVVLEKYVRQSEKRA